MSKTSIDLFNACKDNDSKTALEILDKNVDVDVNYIEKKNNNNSSLLWALCNNMIEVSWKLINMGANIHHRNTLNYSTLHYCVVKNSVLKIEYNVENNLKLVEYLLQNKVNINSINKYMETALLNAIYYKYDKITLLLIDNNASLDIQNIYGDTALHYASEYGNIEICDKLLIKGTNINIQNTSGETALIIACKNNCIDVLDLLIKNNTNLDIVDNNNNTALKWACRNCYPNIVKLLLENKADMNVVNHNGVSVFESSLSNTVSFDNNAKIIKLLLQYKYKPNDHEIDLLKKRLISLKETNVIIQDPYGIMIAL